MVRLLILLLGMLTTNKVADRRPALYRDDLAAPDGDSWAAASGTLVEPAPGSPTGPAASDRDRDRDGNRDRGRVTRRRRIPRWVKWAAVLALVTLIFRKALAFAVITALSAVLHVVGFNVHLPHVKLSWPWQSVTAGEVTDTSIGPWVLQKIEGISKPALGTETFNFAFTHKVSKNIGIWPCWYSSTFYAVGRASATVNLNPGPAWWAKDSGHYRLQVLSRPVIGKPGRVSIAIVLPQPQLPQSAHDVSIDNSLSQPIDTQHSWTYPGFGCGELVRPQFSESALYSLAQSIAFDRVTHMPQVSRPLIAAAENEASQIIRNNFIQPTLNALGYDVQTFSLNWAPTS